MLQNTNNNETKSIRIQKTNDLKTGNNAKKQFKHETTYNQNRKKPNLERRQITIQNEKQHSNIEPDKNKKSKHKTIWNWKKTRTIKRKRNHY